ncbi:MAG: Fe-S cluster assembly transcriptional regulator IscR, partial [Burkholderiales bacterium]
MSGIVILEYVNQVFEAAMRLTTKGRFAVTAMVDLAMRQSRGPVTL